MKGKFDFSGYATKVGLKCSDGRTILKDAFKHNDGQTVPLVWQHQHNEPSNILGHAVLEHRNDGVYAYCKFNSTEAGNNAKQLVEHGDITALSIYANELKEKAKQVMHGMIREVSLVLSGANPGALIDNLCFAHADGSLTGEVDETEAIIYTGLTLSHGEEAKEEDSEEDDQTEGKGTATHSATDPTIKEIFDGMTDQQKTVVYAMLSNVIGSPASMDHSNKEGNGVMKTNVFDKKTKEDEPGGPVLTHAQFQTIMETAKKSGSLKEAVLSHAAEYGIDNIEILFPEAQNVRTTPDIVGRDQSWVAGVLGGCQKTPFSRIRSQSADFTEDEARAKGYITGEFKKEQVFPVMKRITTPTTIYKKQKLDRDNIVDITSFDVVAWIKGEMRVMLNEEIGRALLIGDGRDIADADHINEDNIRPIWKDDDFYSHKLQVDPSITTLELIDEIVRARKNYKGTGSPTLYTTVDVVTDMLLVRDTLGRKIYPTMAELTSALRVANIVEVEVMENQTRTDGEDNEFDLIGILVNLSDYTLGADKGGQVAMFDDFDIDYNQYKYLIETRLSGCLTRWKSAVVIEKEAASG